MYEGICYEEDKNKVDVAGFFLQSKVYKKVTEEQEMMTASSLLPSSPSSSYKEELNEPRQKIIVTKLCIRMCGINKF